MRYCILVLMAVMIVALLVRSGDNEQKVSEFGKYKGYSSAVYDGHKRFSDYLNMPDGTRLAYDLFLPTKNGAVTGKPLPTLLKYTPYSRAWTVYDRDGNNSLMQVADMPWYLNLALRVRRAIAPNGNVMDALFRTKWLNTMVASGYAVIVIDRPGTGASFGTMSSYPEVIAKELDQILDWIAAQKWSDGNIGMFGDSIQAQVQFYAASTANPHLKAIFPATTWMDNYTAVVYPGGVMNKGFLELYVKLNRAFNLGIATPVDSDVDGTAMAEAQAERGNKTALGSLVGSLKSGGYRDAATSQGIKWWEEYQALYPLLPKINASGVPVYLINGWYDIYARDNFLIYANLTGPKRLIVRPTDHNGIEAPGSDVDISAEAHRWFDYWLKGIDNGIMSEPPIHYYLQTGVKRGTWCDTNAWPVNNQTSVAYYFARGNSEKTLETQARSDQHAFDEYTVNYTTTTGQKPRWRGVAEAHQYPNMRTHDAKALAYTTSPLKETVTVVGHPVLRVWLSADVPDLDVFAYLQKVDVSGNSTYVTEGILKASRRAMSRAPFENLGLPWHDHSEESALSLPANTPVELTFDLLPTAYEFKPDERIRVTIAFADDGNFDTPALTPAPVVRVFRDVKHQSYIELPVLTNR